MLQRGIALADSASGGGGCPPGCTVMFPCIAESFSHSGEPGRKAIVRLWTQASDLSLYFTLVLPSCDLKKSCRFSMFSSSAASGMEAERRRQLNDEHIWKCSFHLCINDGS